MALNQFNRFVYVSLFSCIFFPHAMHSANVNQQWKQSNNENNNNKKQCLALELQLAVRFIYN